MEKSSFYLLVCTFKDAAKDDLILSIFAWTIPGPVMDFKMIIFLRTCQYWTSTWPHDHSYQAEGDHKCVHYIICIYAVGMTMGMREMQIFTNIVNITNIANIANMRRCTSKNIGAWPSLICITYTWINLTKTTRCIKHRKICECCPVSFLIVR